MDTEKWSEECCPVCNLNAKMERLSKNHMEHYCRSYECETCGSFIIDETFEACVLKNHWNQEEKDRLASYLFYNNKCSSSSKKYAYIKGDAEPAQPYKNDKDCSVITKDLVDAWYPKSFAEKVDVFLLGMYERQNCMGDIVQFTDESRRSACFVLRHPSGMLENTQNVCDIQAEYFLNYMAEEKYIQKGADPTIPNRIIPKAYTIAPKGMHRIDMLLKNANTNSKTVFIAMDFHHDSENIREAIKKAIIEQGFVPRIIDEVEYNDQVVPEILFEIRQAKFVIAELSYGNQGVYYEAGYALGKGKEVLHVCKKEEFDDNHVHFDVKQINTILWKTYDDLTKKLSERIRSTID